MSAPIVAAHPPPCLTSSLPRPRTPSARPSPSLDTLPPELLSTIFALSPRLPPPAPSSLDPYAHLAPAAPLRLDPTCTAIARALVPAARANAYQCATVRGAASLAKLERTVGDGDRAQQLGALVRVLEVVDARPAGAGTRSDPADERALKRTARATLDALPALEHLVVACPAPGSAALQRALLSREALSAGAFSSSSSAAAADGGGVRLTVLSGAARPVCVADLDEGVRGAGPGLRAVEVFGRMGLKRAEGDVRDEGREGREGGRGVKRVVMEVEGHAQGLSAFLDGLPALSHLSLRSFSADAAAALSALTPATRARLRTVEFRSTGYLHRPLCALPPLLSSLTHLTLSSPALILTPAFLLALDDSTPHLATLVLRGPHTADERAAGAATLELLGDWVGARAVRVEHERAQGHGLGPEGFKSALRELEVDTMANPLNSPALAPARNFLSFVDASPTPFHAVANCVAKLEKAGFSRLHERDSWADKIKPGSKLFVTRNQSSIIAFTVPADAGTKPLGISVAGCHTDSPRFILKPVSKREKVGFTQVGVETYGGGLWATWMDRDLGLAGRVTLSGAKGASADTYTSHLVLVREPILRMPTIAIHLERTQNDKFFYNPETQQVPILALASKELNKTLLGDNGGSATAGEVSFADPLDITSHHSPVLLHTVARQLSAELGEEVTPAQIHDFELSLFDVQPATIGGALNEFIFSARLDNLFSSFAATEALIAASESTSTPSDGRVAMMALFDNEEVGSVSAYGAESNFIESVIERVAVALKGDGETEAEAYQRTLAKSFLLSTDVAHSVHPGFVEKHEENHRPLINSGIVIKTNSKQRYATTSNTVFPLRRVAAEAGVPLTEFVVRNDCACGSTIGPLVSKIGLRTVDIGAPILSMHSIREMGGVKDMAQLVALFRQFFLSFGRADTVVTD
ncbi:hypothetical protein JCM3775_006925 [Rhodotorula graminis]